MRLRFALPLVLLLVTAAPELARGQVVGGIVSQEEANRHGLTRSWYGQADVDGTLGGIAGVTLYDGTLFVSTSRAQLQAMDAETGAKLWSVSVGNERYPCTAPAASADYVATINGSTLYVIDRKTGREAWHKEMPSVPGSGPAVTPTHVFVPMVNGTMMGYLLKDPKAIPFRYKSFGRILVQPVVTKDSIGWTTEQGYMYLMHLDDPEHLAVNFRLDTKDKIESRPGFWTPYFYSVSLDGYVYAVHEETGRIHWKFSAAEPITQDPIAVNGKVFASVQDGGMFCLNGETGIEEWYAPSIRQFVAMSPTRVYAIDRLNRMIILDAKTGSRLDAMPISGISKVLANIQSDRIFMTTGRGAIQCLHETELSKPETYNPPPLKAEEKPKTKQKKLDEAEEEAPADEAAPAEDEPMEEAPAAEEDNPFGAGADQGAEEGGEEPAEKMEAEDDNPFG